ncbi:hypothetical protein EI94DRAFT_1552995, partial [Lactarius quietus]
WLQFQSNYLHILLKMEGKPASDRCSMCIGQAVIKCPDCFGTPSFCKDCALESHRCSPFHHSLLWTMTHYTQVSLQSLGFALCLGHAASGNPLFTVVDRSGVFNMEVVFCVCSNGGDTDEQLLQAMLFPATFKQIETLFTHSVLEDFLTDNLECKTTAQQYYSKLQSMT